MGEIVVRLTNGNTQTFEGVDNLQISNAERTHESGKTMSFVDAEGFNVQIRNKDIEFIKTKRDNG